MREKNDAGNACFVFCCYEWVFLFGYLCGQKNCCRFLSDIYFLFVKLCEWAEGSKTLSACGIKNPMASRGEKYHSNDKDSTARYSSTSINIDDCIENGINVALQVYDRTVGDLHSILKMEDIDYKYLSLVSSACLTNLNHIASLCRIAEYNNRCGANVGASVGANIGASVDSVQSVVAVQSLENSQQTNQSECAYEDAGYKSVAHAVHLVKDNAPSAGLGSTHNSVADCSADTLANEDLVNSDLNILANDTDIHKSTTAYHCSNNIKSDIPP